MSHHSSIVMLLLLFSFALMHSSGASLRNQAERKIGARTWRLLFAALSIPSAVVLIGYFLSHRYDGILLWNVQGIFGMLPIVWIVTAISFIFLYPATYNLLEIPAILKPKVRLYTKGIIRVTRHPQAIGQILWCASHMIWIGSTFMVVTSAGLIGYHIFSIWHGDQRLKMYFKDAFDNLKRDTSILPFIAIWQGSQQFLFEEFLRPAQVGIVAAIGVFWWSHRFVTVASVNFLGNRLEALFNLATHTPKTNIFPC
uniref:NnrU domain-containing protein n=1 Tax=Paulinella chromatophora TaxID=39717 RepID=B1X490_PAUCH|nr:hypothetical protein PCC_0318 [Paulinella chromatophora]ACB42759.1 hypothetical protein PCC_0318 [Paulinella chromatophora]